MNHPKVPNKTYECFHCGLVYKESFSTAKIKSMYCSPECEEEDRVEMFQDTEQLEKDNVVVTAHRESFSIPALLQVKKEWPGEPAMPPRESEDENE